MDEFDRTRRIDWRTMSHKLADALGRYLANPGPGETEWAEKMMFRYVEMVDNERHALPTGSADK